MSEKFLEGGIASGLSSVPRLITRYVHNANRTVPQITALDTTTGIFTTASDHGLSVNDAVMLGFTSDIDPKYIPDEWAPNGQVSLNVATVVSTTQFTVKLQNVEITSYATKATVDFNKFFLETTVGGGNAFPAVVLSGFSTTHLKVLIVSAKGDGNSYIASSNLSGQTWKGTGSFFAYGYALNSNATHAIYRPLFAEVNIYIMNERAIVRSYVDQSGLYSTGIVDKSPGEKYAYSTTKLTNPILTDFTVNGGFTTGTEGLLNGSIVELYDMAGV